VVAITGINPKRINMSLFLLIMIIQRYKEFSDVFLFQMMRKVVLAVAVGREN